MSGPAAGLAPGGSSRAATGRGGSLEEHPEPRSRTRGRRRVTGALAVAAVLAMLAVRLLVAEPFAIPSASMAPTLTPGDHVLVDKLAYRGGIPRRGELVVFRAPASGEITLKRVVAVAGDTVGIEDGVLVVNGTKRRERYADPRAIDSVYFGPVDVRAGTVFVLGDNRLDSTDSRDFGAVPTSSLMGRVRARIWPPARWGAPR
jgi:signal peptidase I